MTIICTAGRVVEDTRYRIIKMHFSDSISGKEWYRSVHSPYTETNIEAQNRYAAKTEIQLVNDEPEIIWNNILDGEGDPVTLVLAAQYNTVASIAKYVLRQFMVSDDPRTALIIEELLTYLNANFPTNVLLSNFLDVTQQDVSDINTRANYILSNKAAINNYRNAVKTI